MLTMSCLLWDKTWDCLASKIKGSGGILSVYVNAWWENENKMGPDSPQQYSVTGREEMGTNRNTGNLLQVKKNPFSLWGMSNTGTGCPEWLWSHHLWRYTKAHWTWSWATCCKWTCSEQKGWTTGSFQPQPFYDSATVNKETSYFCSLSSNFHSFPDCFPVSHEKLFKRILILQITNRNFQNSDYSE